MITNDHQEEYKNNTGEVGIWYTGVMEGGEPFIFIRLPRLDVDETRTFSSQYQDGPMDIQDAIQRTIDFINQEKHETPVEIPTGYEPVKNIGIWRSS